MLASCIIRVFADIAGRSDRDRAGRIITGLINVGMGEGSVDQVVEYRLMARVRRGAHDLDLEVFGNVTRIGVRDIQRRILLPDRVDGLGRIVLGQRNQFAAMVLRTRSIRLVCPAKERVAVTGRLAFVDVDLVAFRRCGCLNIPARTTNVVKLVNQMVGIPGSVAVSR